MINFFILLNLFIICGNLQGINNFIIINIILDCIFIRLLAHIIC